MAKWSGWWEQQGYGRQEMRNLLLEVSPEGEMSGTGDDCVGSFTIKGTIAPPRSADQAVTSGSTPSSTSAPTPARASSACGKSPGL